jgi:hypothetical protein
VVHPFLFFLAVTGDIIIVSNRYNARFGAFVFCLLRS